MLTMTSIIHVALDTDFAMGIYLLVEINVCRINTDYLFEQ